MTKKQAETNPVIDNEADEDVEAAVSTGYMIQSIKYNNRWLEIGKPVSVSDFAEGDFDAFVLTQTIELDSN